MRGKVTDGLASWHKRAMYMLHLALKTILLYNIFRSVSDTSQIGGKIQLNCLVRLT